MVALVKESDCKGQHTLCTARRLNPCTLALTTSVFYFSFLSLVRVTGDQLQARRFFLAKVFVSYIVGGSLYRMASEDPIEVGESKHGGPRHCRMSSSRCQSLAFSNSVFPLLFFFPLFLHHFRKERLNDHSAPQCAPPIIIAAAQPSITLLHQQRTTLHIFQLNNTL